MVFHKYAESYGRLLAIIPWIRFILPNWCGYNPIFEGNANVYKFVETLIDAELEAWEKDGDGTESDNFVQLYGAQMRLAKDQSIANSSYHRKL